MATISSLLHHHPTRLSVPIGSQSRSLPSSLLWTSHIWRRCGSKLSRHVVLSRCVKRTDEDEVFVAEELEKTNFHQHDGINLKEDDDASDLASGGGQDSLGDRASSVRTVAVWVSAALAFGIAVGLKDGVGKASEFFAGYILEQSLSVDNLFVFVLVFKYFKVPKKLSEPSAFIWHRWGNNLPCNNDTAWDCNTSEVRGSELIVSLYSSLLILQDYYDGDRFFTIKDGIWKATPLLLTVAVIELSDIAFAVDSIPAVFGVTRDPLIVFSSNLFAISGLRALYILISESMSELEYLQPAIGVVLGFIGTKMAFDFFGYHVSTEVSLGIVATTLSAGVILSLRKNSDENS